MDYKVTPQSGKSYIHMWDVASTKAFEGGFLFDKACVPAGTEKLPKGLFMKADFTERKAVIVKTAVLFEALTALATSVKIAKGSLLIATDKVAVGEKNVVVGDINTTNANYDSFAITANDLGVLALGTVLQACDAEGAVINPDGISTSDVELDAQPSVDIYWKVEGIVKSAMPQGVTAAIEASLPFCQFLKA